MRSGSKGGSGGKTGDLSNYVERKLLNWRQRQPNGAKVGLRKVANCGIMILGVLYPRVEDSDIQRYSPKSASEAEVVELLSLHYSLMLT